MARLKLSESLKKARHERAKRSATALNKKLASHKHTYTYATESGKVAIYFEPPGQKKVRIHSPFPSIEFDAELLAAKRGQPLQIAPSKAQRPSNPKVTVEHSVRWGCQNFFDTAPQYRQMSLRDRRNWRNVLGHICEEPIFPGSPLTFGEMPLSEFNAESVQILMKRKLQWIHAEDAITGVTREVQTNFSAANTRHKFISAVLSFHVQNHIRVVGGRNVARDIKPFKPENDEGHRTPSLEELELFRSVHPLGTKARLLFDLAYYTTQRRADLPRLGHQFLGKDRYGLDRLVFTQHKLRNKKPVIAYVPIFSELQRSLDAARDAGILGDLFYLVQHKHSPNAPDRPYVEGSLGNMMQDAIKIVREQAGLKEPFSLHGLRKAGVCRLILRDLSIHQIMAITGHRTPKEIDRYGRNYMRSAASEEGHQRYLNWRLYLGSGIEAADELGGRVAETA